ncbi:MAG: hypothetical protein M1820_005324 [Bogoriella megaspora]|nr:MAG: hypothetical protein M1820_005324 [Bogoriella megaspora]
MSKRKPVPNPASEAAGPSSPSTKRESSPAALTSNAPPDIQTDIPSDEPPIYSGPSMLRPSSALATPSSPQSTVALQQSLIAGLPNLPWSKYQIPDSTLSSDSTTLTTTFPLYSSEPRALEAFLREQASLPPRPRIRILGTSNEGMTRDFDISLNMMHYILRRSPLEQQWNYVRVENTGTATAKPKRSKSSGNTAQEQDGLRNLVERYCEDKALTKTFVFQRAVNNWNKDFIEGSIRNLLAQMNYRGSINIAFPLELEKLVIQSPPKGNKFLHGVKSLFAESREYQGVYSIWPYATLSPAAEGGDNRERQFAVQSEEAWWRDWKGAIAGAIRARRKGWVSVEDQIELAMMPRS